MQLGNVIYSSQLFTPQIIQNNNPPGFNTKVSFFRDVDSVAKSPVLLL